MCLLLGIFCLFLFRDIIIGGHLLFGSDFVACYLGIKQFLLNQIHVHHSIPFWNPLIFGGIPFWAHFESTIFYPLDILFWIIPPERAYGYTMFAHLFLAGLFMYILSRSFRITTLGSFVAAAVFTCNGYVMATLHTGQMFRVQGYTWIPLIIYFLNQALTRKRPYFSATMAGLFWGVQILAGSAQDPFYTFLAALLFLGCSIRSVKEVRYSAKILAISCIFFLIGSGVAAIQLVPAFEFIGQSVRAALDSYDLVTIGSYPPEGIVTAAMPHFFGSYVKRDYWVSDVPWSVPDYNLYVGILPLILLFFVSYRGSDNGRVVAFAGILAIVAFVLALGLHTPVYKLAYLLPGFDRIRAPAKIIVLWVFALCLLAGKGMDDLFCRRKTSLLRRAGLALCLVMSLVVLDTLFHIDRSIALKFFSPFILDEAIADRMIGASNIICGELHRLVLFSAFILVTILFLIRGTLRPKLAAVFLCALLLIDVSYANRGAVQHNDNFYHRVSQLKHNFDMILGKDKDIYRIGSYDLMPNIEMYLGYQTVGGYNPLFPLRYYEYINQYFRGQLPEAWVWFSYRSLQDSKLMDLLNVKYEISNATREYSVRKTCLPRAFIVRDYKILKKKEVLDYLIRPDFDPTRVVLLEEGVDPGNLSAHPGKESRNPGLAEIVSYRPDHIVVSTHSPTPGYLFLSEMYYPGWKAFVDDQPIRILRGNYLFRVVQLPEGQHIVRFVFDPLSIKIGIGITILTLFVIMGVVVYYLGKRMPFLNRNKASS